ncbi:Uncharacterised protein [Acinetobacter baumannii]|nr:Uncharacterised protein [Acinetobacter baumannii]
MLMFRLRSLAVVSATGVAVSAGVYRVLSGRFNAMSFSFTINCGESRVSFAATFLIGDGFKTVLIC